MSDTVEFDDSGYAYELAVSKRLENYLTRILSNIDPPPLIQCRPIRDGDALAITCNVAIEESSFSEAEEFLASELRVIERSDDVTRQVIDLKVVIPATAKSGIETTQSLFTLTLARKEDQASHDEEMTIPIAKGNIFNPNYGKSADEMEHVILLVHGIKDIGAWQRKVSSQLVRQGTTVEQIRYGLYPAIRFLFPLNLSNGAVIRVLKQLRDLKAQYPNAKISVIAHSFGTYVTLKAIERGTELRIWKLVFCGSVADDQYAFQHIAPRVGDGIGSGKRPTRDFVLNDCGTGDVWPVIGAAFGWYYGMAGATGFSEGFVTNRFHRAIDGKQGGHGLYFHPQFVKEHWRPFLIEDIAPIEGNGEQGEHLPFYVKPLYHGWVRVLCKVFASVAWLSIIATAAFVLVWLIHGDIVMSGANVGSIFDWLSN